MESFREVNNRRGDVVEIQGGGGDTGVFRGRSGEGDGVKGGGAGGFLLRWLLWLRWWLHSTFTAIIILPSLPFLTSLPLPSHHWIIPPLLFSFDGPPHGDLPILQTIMNIRRLPLSILSHFVKLFPDGAQVFQHVDQQGRSVESLNRVFIKDSLPIGVVSVLEQLEIQ